MSHPRRTRRSSACCDRRRRYVAVLVPKLPDAGYQVTVPDFPGTARMCEGRREPRLREVKGDIRDAGGAAGDGDARGDHLAHLERPVLRAQPRARPIDQSRFRTAGARRKGVWRQAFRLCLVVLVYGIKEGAEVTEDLPPEPLTTTFQVQGGMRGPALTEKVPGFTTVTIGPATVCGYSPRQRLRRRQYPTISACTRARSSVFAASQPRPNIHIEDMAAPISRRFRRRTGTRRQGLQRRLREPPVMQLAICRNVGEHVKLEVRPHVICALSRSSKKIKTSSAYPADRDAWSTSSAPS